MVWHPRSKDAESATANVKGKIFRISTSFECFPETSGDSGLLHVPQKMRSANFAFGLARKTRTGNSAHATPDDRCRRSRLAADSGLMPRSSAILRIISRRSRWLKRSTFLGETLLIADAGISRQVRRRFRWRTVLTSPVLPVGGGVVETFERCGTGGGLATPRRKKGTGSVE